MSIWEAVFPGSLPLSEEIEENVLDRSGTMELQLFRGTYSNLKGDDIQVLPDLFYPNGHLVTPLENTFCPWQAAGLMGYALPWGYANIEEGYSNRASQAAVTLRRLPGALLRYPGFQIAVPLKPALKSPDGCVVDSTECDELWENGLIPQHILLQFQVQAAFYAEAMSRLSAYSPKKRLPHFPKNIFPAGYSIVRCCSNLASTLLYRNLTITKDSAEYAKQQFLIAVERKVSTRDMGYSPVVAERVQWAQERQSEIDAAYKLPDPSGQIYADLRRYMELRSKRKELEKEEAQKKAAEDAAAMELASHLGDACQGAAFDTANKRKYTVTQCKSAQRQSKVTPEMIRANCPFFENCIKQETVSGGIMIDVL